jgi:hypothetical protein
MQLSFDVHVRSRIPVDSRVCGKRFLGHCIACGVRISSHMHSVSPSICSRFVTMLQHYPILCLVFLHMFSCFQHCPNSITFTALVKVTMTYNLIIDPVAGDIVPVPLQPVVKTVNQQLTKFVCKEHFLWLHWQEDLTKPLEDAIDTKIASQSTVTCYYFRIIHYLFKISYHVFVCVVVLILY